MRSSVRSNWSKPSSSGLLNNESLVILASSLKQCRTGGVPRRGLDTGGPEGAAVIPYGYADPRGQAGRANLRCEIKVLAGNRQPLADKKKARRKAAGPGFWWSQAGSNR